MSRQDVLDALKVARAVMKEVTRGLTGMMPHEWTRRSIHGRTRGIRPPQQPKTQDYHLARDSQKRSIKPPQRFGYYR